MFREFFGLLIAICRRWMIGSDYDVKTSKARDGLAVICTFYIIGLIVNTTFYFEPEVPSWVLADVVVGGGIIVAFIVPMFLFRKIYTRDLVEFYINKYRALNNIHAAKQHVVAFFFCFGGWYILARPFISIPA